MSLATRDHSAHLPDGDKSQRMREIAPNVYQLAGFPPNVVNTYLITDPAGDVLIDAGSRWDRARIARQLTGRRLALVALTHVHPDHQGAAAAICQRFEVPLACHPADRAAMEGSAPMEPPSTMLAISRAVFSGPAYPVQRLLHDGDPLASFQVIHSPGHTPGHVVFWRAVDRIAIVGDVLNGMNLLTSWPGLHEPPAFFTWSVAENRRSIHRLLELAPRTLLFGHGPPLCNNRQLHEFVETLDRNSTVPVPATSG